MRRGDSLVFELAGHNYRRSEETWDEAGRPTARVVVSLGPNELVIDVTVRKLGELTFVPADATNPYDNESPDINGDGVQLYFVDASGASAWVMVPEPASPEQGRVRARVIDGWQSPRVLRASWQRSDGGYAVRARIPLPGRISGSEFALGVVVALGLLSGAISTAIDIES